MNVPTSEAFSIFEDWKERKSALSIMMGPTRRAGGVEGGVKDSGVITGVSPESGEVVALVGSPESGQRELVFKFSGASFATDTGALTAELPDGGMVFFFERKLRDTGHTPVA
jgi:hypothetical protein